MFKAVAEFAMRGRTQAVTVALIGSWFPFISQAAFGLVTLRKGWQEGLLIALWASLPAFIGLWMAREAVSIVEASLAIYLLGFIACCVLRVSVSWPLTLLVIVVLSGISALVLVAISASLVTDVNAFFEQALRVPEGAPAASVKPLVDQSAASVAGLVSVWIGVTTVGGVLMARWWQGLLYNPGGFRSEFHALRMPPMLALACIAAVLVGLALGERFIFWAALPGLPLGLAGLGLAHWLIQRFSLGTAYVVGLYLVTLVMPLSMALLTVLAVVDALSDIRNRLKLDPPHSA